MQNSVKRTYYTYQGIPFTLHVGLNKADISFLFESKNNTIQTQELSSEKSPLSQLGMNISRLTLTYTNTKSLNKHNCYRDLHSEYILVRFVSMTKNIEYILCHGYTKQRQMRTKHRLSDYTSQREREREQCRLQGFVCSVHHQKPKVST